MRYTIDRIEGGVAVCEDETGALSGIALEELPADVREGSAVVCQDGLWRLADNEEDRRRIRNKMNKLFG